jgi:hypothetical protein
VHGARGFGHESRQQHRGKHDANSNALDARVLAVTGAP